MENLLYCRGMKFGARIGADKDIYYTEGIIQVEGNKLLE